MPDHTVPRSSPHYPVRPLALLVGAGVMIVAGALWLVAVAEASDRSNVVMAWGGAVAVVLLGAAVGTCVHFAGAARSWSAVAAGGEGNTAQWDRAIAEVARETVPALAALLREDPALESALARLTPPASATLQGLVRCFGTELAGAEQRARSEAGRWALLEEELARFTQQELPAIEKQIRDKISPGTVLAELAPFSVEPVAELARAVVTRLGEAERRGSAATAASANAAARVQAQATSLLGRLRELQHEYGDDEELFGHLLTLDHQVSQLGRLADGIALLSGGRSGRRWTKPIGMESILRGAMGRIEAYRRIQLNLASSSAVVGHAAEGVMHLLAELMDNATAFSPRYTTVHVYAEEVDAGVVITIEDSGVSMRQRELDRAQTLVSARADLTTLAGTRLGLAVVGRLASKYDLSVSFRPSSRGGTGVVVMVPRRLITQPRQYSPQPPALTAAGRAEAATTLADDGTQLPRRRPGSTLVSAAQPTMAPAPSAESARDAGVRFAAFRSQTGNTGPIPVEGENDS